MATVAMKYAMVCGPLEMRSATLETLLDLGALELHKRSVASGDRAARHALVSLYGRVRACASLAVEPFAPDTPTPDLVGLAARLLEECDTLGRQRNDYVGTLIRQELWGDCSPLHLNELAEQEVFIQCWRSDDKANIVDLHRQGSVIWRAPATEKRHEEVFFTLSRGAPLQLDWASNLPSPDTQPDLIRAQIYLLDAKLEGLQGTLRWIACSRMDEFSRQLAQQVDALSLAAGTIQSYADDAVFVVSGWIPVTHMDDARARIAALQGVSLSLRDPQPGEEPPTLSRYPRWSRPIQSIFEFMGYRPGYAEYDAGNLIILFFTVFSALLINDGGYGLLMLLGLTLGYRRLIRRLGVGAVQLGLYVAGATTIYGALTGSFFGMQFTNFAGVHFLSLDTDDMIKLSFGLGIVHLSLGRLIQAKRLGWSALMLNEIGWLLMLWAVFLGIISVFTGGDIPAASAPLLGVGALLVVLFARSDLGFGRGILAGAGHLLGNATTLFSDMMSYIRIMAVGFASMSLAMTTNLMAEQTNSLFFGGLILLLGHSINLGLGLIALFVHGLRLNTLEFARQLGVIWSGRAFEPMAHFQLQELEER